MITELNQHHFLTLPLIKLVYFRPEVGVLLFSHRIQWVKLGKRKGLQPLLPITIDLPVKAQTL